MNRLPGGMNDARHCMLDRRNPDVRRIHGERWGSCRPHPLRTGRGVVEARVVIDEVLRRPHVDGDVVELGLVLLRRLERLEFEEILVGTGLLRRHVEQPDEVGDRFGDLIHQHWISLRRHRPRPHSGRCCIPIGEERAGHQTPRAIFTVPRAEPRSAVRRRCWCSRRADRGRRPSCRWYCRAGWLP